jgi:hypothetical protein
VDLLPSYLRFRAITDVQRGTGTPRLRDNTSSPASNYISWAFEFGIVLFITISVARGAARKTYCEFCGRWKRRQLATYEAGLSDTIAQMIEHGRLHELQEIVPIALQRQRKYTAVAAEYCPPPARPDRSACDVMVSVKEVTRGGGLGALSQWDMAWGKLRLDRLVLKPNEIATLAKVFPQLQQASDASVPQPTPAEPRTWVARITPIEHETSATKLLTWQNATIGNLILFSGFALIGLGAWIMYIGATTIEESQNFREPIVRGVLITIAGGLVLIAGFASYIPNTTFLGNQWFWRKTRRLIGQRANRVVDPSADDAVFVEIVPRVNWGRAMLETATDVGFIQIDRYSRELRFEGDREQIVCPRDAIESVALGSFTVGAGMAGATTYHALLVVMHTADGSREIPFIPRMYRWRLGSHTRRLAALDLYQSLT